MDGRIDNDIPDQEEIRRKLLENEQKLHHIFTKEQYRFYVPIGKGEEFINLISSGEYISILLEAANGIGKTMLVANFLAHLFWPANNRFFQGKLFKNWTYPKKGRIISDPNTVTETIIPMLKLVFPQGRIRPDGHLTTTKDGKRFESHWITDTGWEFTIMTYEQEAKEFESATLGFVWMDEPPPKDIYIANWARLRKGGILMITETPLSGSQWLYDEFIEIDEDKKQLQKKAIVHAEIEDACKEHGVRGFLEHHQIETMISQYDDDEKQARAFGKHAHLSGLIFKKWDEGIHIIKPFYMNPREWLVVHALDTHPRIPDAGLWVGFGVDNRIVICDELWFESEDGDTEELAVRLKQKNSNYRMSTRLIIEPAAFNVDKHTGKSLAGDLQILGLIYEPGSKDLQLGIREIRNKINFQYQNGLWIKKPILYSFDTNIHLNWEMKHYQWEDWRGRAKELKNPKETPVDKNDHFIEDLRRILLSGITYEPPRYESNEQPTKSPTLDPYSNL